MIPTRLAHLIAILLIIPQAAYGIALPQQPGVNITTGDIKTHSGRDTRIEASVLDAQGAIDLGAGTEATYNEDGSIKTEGTEGNITFAAVKDSTYTSVEDSQNSMPWQSSTGHGEFKETLQLANIKAGRGLSVDATGEIIVDIPEVPAPVEVVVEEPLPTTGPDGKPLTEAQKAVLLAERAARAGTYLAGTAMGADPGDVAAATLFMSNLSDALSAPVMPRIGLSPAYGSTSASASAASVEAYLGLRNPSGNTTNSANAARNQYYGVGESASPSPGTNAAGSSGASANTSLMSRPDFYVNSLGDALPATGYRYMDSQYAPQTQASMSAPLSYFGFTDYPTGMAARDGYQIYFEQAMRHRGVTQG